MVPSLPAEEGACVALKQTEDSQALWLVVTLPEFCVISLCLSINTFHAVPHSVPLHVLILAEDVFPLHFHPELLFILKTWSSVIFSVILPGKSLPWTLEQGTQAIWSWTGCAFLAPSSWGGASQRPQPGAGTNVIWAGTCPWGSGFPRGVWVCLLQTPLKG